MCIEVLVADISSMATVLYVWLCVINIWKYYEAFLYRIC